METVFKREQLLCLTTGAAQQSIVWMITRPHRGCLRATGVSATVMLNIRCTQRSVSVLLSRCFCGSVDLTTVALASVLGIAPLSAKQTCDNCLNDGARSFMARPPSPTRPINKVYILITLRSGERKVQASSHCFLWSICDYGRAAGVVALLTVSNEHRE